MDLVDLIRNSDKIRNRELSEVYFKQEGGCTIYSYFEKNYREGKMGIHVKLHLLEVPNTYINKR